MQVKAIHTKNGEKQSQTRNQGAKRSDYLRTRLYCSVFRYESNGIFVLGWVFFLQTNFDFLTIHF